MHSKGCLLRIQPCVCRAELARRHLSANMPGDLAKPASSVFLTINCKLLGATYIQCAPLRPGRGWCSSLHIKAAPYASEEVGSHTRDSKLCENAHLPCTGMSFRWLRLRLHGSAAYSLRRRGTMSGLAAPGSNRPKNRSSGSRTAPSRAENNLSCKLGGSC